MKKHFTMDELTRLNILMEGSEAKNPEEELCNSFESYHRTSGLALNKLQEAFAHVQSVSGWLGDPSELSEDVIAGCACNLSRVLALLGDVYFTLDEIHTYTEDDLQIAEIIGLGAEDPEREQD